MLTGRLDFPSSTEPLVSCHRGSQGRYANSLLTGSKEEDMGLRKRTEQTLFPTNIPQSANIYSLYQACDVRGAFSGGASILPMKVQCCHHIANWSNACSRLHAQHQKTGAYSKDMLIIKTILE